MNSAHQCLAVINSSAKDTCVSVESVAQRVKDTRCVLLMLAIRVRFRLVKLVLLLFPSHTRSERHLFSIKKLSKYLKSGD